MVGEFPGLTNLDVNENVLKTSDFRGMYCSLLEQWFQTEAGLGDPGSVVVRTARPGQVKASRAAMPMLLAGVLGLLCATSGAAALASSGDPPHHRRPQTARACHCSGHRRCLRTKAKHERMRCITRKPSAPPHSTSAGSAGSASSALSTPWASSPAPGAPNSGVNSEAPPVIAPGTVPPGEAPAAPVLPAHVEVTAEDTEAFRFVLSRPTVPAGKVIIEFVNHGQDEHNLNAIEPTEGSVEGSIPNTAANAHPSLTLNLRPGSYTLFCSIADHEAKGMKATLVVD